MYDAGAQVNQMWANLNNALAMGAQNRRQQAQLELQNRYAAVDQQMKETSFQTQQELAAQQEEMNALQMREKEVQVQEQEKQQGINRLILLSKISAGVKDQGTLDAARDTIGKVFGPDALDGLPEQYNRETQEWIDDNNQVLSSMIQKEGNLKQAWVAPKGAPEDRQPFYYREGVDANKIGAMLTQQGMQFVAPPTYQVEQAKVQAEAEQQRLNQEQQFTAEQNQLDRETDIQQKQMEVAQKKAAADRQMTNQDRGIANKLAASFKSDPYVSKFKEISGQMDNMKEASEIAKKLEAEGVTDAQSYSSVDQAYVLSFNKFMDPKSAVMEGEFARYGLNRSVMSKMNSYVNKMTNGEGLLPAERNDIEELTGRLYKAALDKFNKVTDKYRRKASDMGLDPDKYTGYITDYADEDAAQLNQDYEQYAGSTGYDERPVKMSQKEKRDVRSEIRKFRENINRLQSATQGPAGPSNEQAINQGAFGVVPRQPVTIEERPQQQNNSGSMSLDAFRNKYGF